MSKTSPFIDIPIVFISALTKQRIFDAIKIAMEVNERRNYKIPTKKLNDIIRHQFLLRIFLLFIWT